jgi:hypothetical protein
MSWHGICGALIKLPVTSKPQESLRRLLPRLPQGSLLALAMRTPSWGTCSTELPTSSFHWRVILKPTLSIHFIFSTCAALDSLNSPPRLRHVALSLHEHRLAPGDFVSGSAFRRLRLYGGAFLWSSS